MTITDQEIDIKGNILQLEGLFIKAIHEFCEKQNHQVTYLEIDAALINTLKKNSENQLRDLAKRKEQDEIDRIYAESKIIESDYI